MHFINRQFGCTLICSKYYITRCIVGNRTIYNLSQNINWNYSSPHGWVKSTGTRFGIPLTESCCSYIHTCRKRYCENVDPDKDMVISYNSFELEERSEVFRNSLYSSSNDPIITQLKSCDSTQSLIDIINDQSTILKSKHYCQFIIVLWDLTKNYKAFSVASPDVIIAFPNRSSLYYNSCHGSESKNHLNSTILKALEIISSDLKNLSVDEVVYTILYASRLGISLKTPSVQSLLTKINTLLSGESTDKLPLPLLSRLSLIFVGHDELWEKLFLIKIIPFIYKYFDRCSDGEDFKALTITMLSTVPYLREELLLEYEALIDELLRNGILTKNHTSIIIKGVLLLNNIYHKPSARQMVYRLLQMLNIQLNKLFIPHLLDLHRVVSLNLEPQFTIKEIEQLKQTSPSHLSSYLHQPLHLVFMPLLYTREASSILKTLVTDTNSLDGLKCLYYVLTTAHTEACYMYWKKVVRLMHLSPDSNLLQWFCLRYMSFSHRMGYYRHKKFELGMLSLITEELVRGSTVYRPREFSLLAAFILWFESARQGDTSLSANILPRLTSMVGQLDVNTCFILSRAFNQENNARRNKRILTEYLKLDTALSIKVREILESQKNLPLVKFNTILRTCINKQEKAESDLIDDIIKRSEHLDWSQLTSRSLRNLVYNLLSTSCLLPTALERMAEYCLDNRHYVTTDTVAKLAHLCYYLGHRPSCASSFWALTSNMVARDHKHLNGLSLLQVALALSFFNHLPASLNRLLFSVDFLERLDNEIKNCFAKDRYPQRAKQTLMQLNRSVCLETPEADVPWFHSKFCEEQQSLGMLLAKTKTLLFIDVNSSLTDMLGDPTYIGKNVITPYGYTVDFQLNLDALLNPVPYNRFDNVSHKLALLLHYKDYYTSYCSQLKGYHMMKQRHLEILGYKVICISAMVWKAMWMGESAAKQQYLRKLIWPS